MTEPATPTDVGELLDLVERLDADNERLRMRVLEVMEWMEEAVTAHAATERELEHYRARADELAAELDAIHNTRSWRMLAPARRVYGSVRRRMPVRR